MRKLSVLLLVLFALTLVPAAGWACSDSPWKAKATEHEKRLGKLDFGFKNLMFGWTEVITEPIHHFRDAKENKLGSGLRGLGVGLYHGVADTLGGALHILTFPLTRVDVRLPEGGV